MRQICVRFASDNYDRWSKLYWKKQLKGDLNPEEEKVVEELEKENLETIAEIISP